MVGGFDIDKSMGGSMEYGRFDTDMAILYFKSIVLQKYFLTSKVLPKYFRNFEVPLKYETRTYVIIAKIAQLTCVAVPEFAADGQRNYYREPHTASSQLLTIYTLPDICNVLTTQKLRADLSQHWPGPK